MAASAQRRGTYGAGPGQAKSKVRTPRIPKTGVLMPAPSCGERFRLGPFRTRLRRTGGNRLRLFRGQTARKTASGKDSPKGDSTTTHRQRADDSLFFTGRGRIRPAERTNAFARHTPSQMARAGMTVLDFAVLRNAETFGGPFVGLQFRHFFTILQKIRTRPGAGRSGPDNCNAFRL